MALLQLPSVEEAVLALIKMHNHQLSDSNHLRVSFSKSNIWMGATAAILGTTNTTTNTTITSTTTTITPTINPEATIIEDTRTTLKTPTIAPETAAESSSNSLHKEGENRHRTSEEEEPPKSASTSPPASLKQPDNSIPLTRQCNVEEEEDSQRNEDNNRSKAEQEAEVDEEEENVEEQDK